MRVTKLTTVLAVLLVACGCDGVVLPLYPSGAEAVTIPSGDVRLSGLLVKPHAAPPYRAIVIVHGSGPSTVDDNAWKIHARVFAKNGFAVLVYDKRGSGKSTGDLATSTYSDFADDVVAAVRFLRDRPDIDKRRIGLFGRSEAGWVSPIAAARDTSIAFVITGVQPAVTPRVQMTYELRNLIAAAEDSAASTRAALARLQQRPHDAMLDFDPETVLVRVRAPMLTVMAGSDRVVNTPESVAVLERLRKTHALNLRIETIAGVDHNMRQPRGVPPHYPKQYLDLITSWADSVSAVGNSKR